MKKPCKKLLCSLLCIVILGCGGSGKGFVNFSGIWDVHVEFSANGCPSNFPILSTLDYAHSIDQDPGQSGFDALTLIDDLGDTFLSGDTQPGEDSFIVTGSSHPLNPFINGANCQETIVWSYFDIADDAAGVFSDNVGRNSLIDCTGPSGPISCNVFYLGVARMRDP